MVERINKISPLEPIFSAATRFINGEIARKIKEAPPNFVMWLSQETREAIARILKQ